MTFADKVKHVRAKLLISQKELASSIGISVLTVSRWESQGLQPRFLTEKKFEAFCKSKGIDFEEIK